MITVYCDGSTESFQLIHTLDELEISYEAKGAIEAHEVGIYGLPAMDVDGKILSYKKALKWAKKQQRG